MLEESIQNIPAANIQSRILEKVIDSNDLFRFHVASVSGSEWEIKNMNACLNVLFGYELAFMSIPKLKANLDGSFPNVQEQLSLFEHLQNLSHEYRNLARLTTTRNLVYSNLKPGKTVDEIITDPNFIAVNARFAATIDDVIATYERDKNSSFEEAFQYVQLNISDAISSEVESIAKFVDFSLPNAGQAPLFIDTEHISTEEDRIIKMTHHLIGNAFGIRTILAKSASQKEQGALDLSTGIRYVDTVNNIVEATRQEIKQIQQDIQKPDELANEMLSVEVLEGLINTTIADYTQSHGLILVIDPTKFKLFAQQMIQWNRQHAMLTLKTLINNSLDQYGKLENPQKIIEISLGVNVLKNTAGKQELYVTMALEDRAVGYPADMLTRKSRKKRNSYSESYQPFSKATLLGGARRGLKAIEELLGRYGGHLSFLERKDGHVGARTEISIPAEAVIPLDAKPNRSSRELTQAVRNAVGTYIKTRKD